MSGILYGLGVGPGDPELLTLKALRLIRENPVIAVPGNDIKASVAYQIVKGAYPKLDEKELIPVAMPMTKDRELLEKSHEEAADRVEECLQKGQNVVFLTLGDPTVYSTGIYIYKRLKKMGYQGEIFSGIPSFCAAAARLEISLVENRQELHVLPVSYGIEEKLKLPGTKVLMKTGKKMEKVKAVLKEEGQQAKMVMNCGMDGEKIYKCTEEIPEDAGYFSIVIAKEKEK